MMQKDTNLAYAVKNFEQQRVAEEPKIQTVVKPKSAPKKRGMVKAFFCMFYVVVLCSALIIGKVQLAEVNMLWQQKQSEYQEIDSEYTRLDTAVSNLISLKSIETRAKELGLGEVKQSQIDYIVVSHDNKVEVIEEENSLASKLTKLYYQIKEYILG